MATAHRPVPPSRRRALRRRLLAWYDQARRDLPWRFSEGQADPYRVWISEAMLQQTQVARVIPYYQRFLARFPTLRALAEAGEEEVLASWSGLGYYARARALHRAARQALALHGGLPASREALEALPGFGPYTAGAVASIAFGLPAPAVDGNVARLLARLFAVDGPVESVAARVRLQAIAADLLGPERPGDWTQALIELGATRCVKPAPRCSGCPVAGLCEARRTGRELELPPARIRPGRRALWLAVGVLRRGEALLLRRRPPGGLFGGLWAPPMVEVSPGRARGAKLLKSLGDGFSGEFGVPVRVGPELASAERTLTHRELTLVAYEVTARRTPRGTGLRLATPLEVEELGTASAVRVLLERLPATATGPSARKVGGGLGKRTVFKYIAPPVAPDSPTTGDEA
jgi:A/G-specific adenine glycosylase